MRLITPVAGGECLYGITPFRHMIEAHSVDIVMIDLIRVGGISNWMKVAAMAEAFNLPVVSHLLPEIHVHLVSGDCQRSDRRVHAVVVSPVSKKCRCR